jgi:hypothetical protein
MSPAGFADAIPIPGNLTETGVLPFWTPVLFFWNQGRRPREMNR